MKALFAVLMIAGVVQGSPVLARSSSASPLLGSWAVDTSRLPTPPEGRPKSVTITFSDAGNEKWTTHVDIVDATGAESHAFGTASLDGTPTPVKDSIEADTAAMKMPSPNVMVMALGKGGMPASTRIYTVAADGKTLIETAAYVGDNGLPLLRTHYFKRVQ